MLEENNQGAGTATEEAPGENTVQVRFLPEGKTVEFEYGTMPYDHHGRPMSFLDVAENYGIFLDHACGGACAGTTCHIWVKDGTGKISEADDDELDRIAGSSVLYVDDHFPTAMTLAHPGMYRRRPRRA